MASDHSKQVSNPIIPNGFLLKRLAAEIRLKIYGLCVPIQGSTRDVPPFLLALAGDKQLYAEAKACYKKSNKLITVSTETEFKTMKLADMFKLTGIKLMFKDDEYVSLRANKCLLFNNFQTIAIDTSLMEPSHLNWYWGLGYALINASGGVTKLVVRVPGQDVASVSQDFARVMAIEGANAKLGVVGKLERLVIWIRGDLVLAERGWQELCDSSSSWKLNMAMMLGLCACAWLWYWNLEAYIAGVQGLIILPLRRKERKRSSRVHERSGLQIAGY